MSAVREEAFAVGDAPSLDAAFSSGWIRVTEGAPGFVRLQVGGAGAGAADISQHGDRVRIEARRQELALTVAVPPGAAVAVRVASADVAVAAAVASLDVATSSGEVDAGDVAGDASVSTASGDVRVGEVGGALRVRSASGDVRAAGCGDGTKVSTASGRVRLDRAGDLTVQAVSGDVLIRRFAGGALDVKTVSGAVRIDVPPGRRLAVDLTTLSGEIRTPEVVTHGGGEASLRVRSVSGDITVETAGS